MPDPLRAATTRPTGNGAVGSLHGTACSTKQTRIPAQSTRCTATLRAVACDTSIANARARPSPPPAHLPCTLTGHSSSPHAVLQLPTHDALGHEEMPWACVRRGQVRTLVVATMWLSTGNCRLWPLLRIELRATPRLLTPQGTCGRAVLVVTPHAAKNVRTCPSCRNPSRRKELARALLVVTPHAAWNLHVPFLKSAHL